MAEIELEAKGNTGGALAQAIEKALAALRGAKKPGVLGRGSEAEKFADNPENFR